MDRFFSIIKLPVALLSLWIFPALLLVLWDFAVAQRYSVTNVPPLVLGFIVYYMLWLLLFRRRELGSYVTTLEHEVTHAVFALATGHKVTRMHVTAKQGGHVVYEGKGNWLISLAPYFFPTVTVLLLTVRMFMERNPWLEGGIGASLAFHVTSTYVETHGAQTDFKHAGRLFSFCFLPSANVLTYTFIALYLNGGWHGILSGLRALYRHTGEYSVLVYHFIENFLRSS